MHCECLSILLCILSDDHCQKNRTEQQFSLGPYRKTFFSCPHLIFLMNKFKFETVSLLLSAERQWDLRSFRCTCDALYIQPSGRERQQVSGGAGGLATRAGGRGGATARWPRSRQRKQTEAAVVTRGRFISPSLETTESTGRGVVRCEMSPLRGDGRDRGASVQDRVRIL